MTRNRTVDRAVSVARATVRGVRSDQVTFIAASLAYYAFVSLLPLLLLALVAASVFGGPDLADRVGEQVAITFGDEAGAVVEDALTSAAGRGGATVVGLAVLLWSGLKLFRGLDVAFSSIYDAPLSDSLLGRVRDGLVTLGAVGLGVAVTVAVGALIAASGARGVLGGVSPVALTVFGTLTLIAALTLTLLPLYYFLPERGIDLREALPGAVFAAVGWTALQTGFRVYAATAGSYRAYGVLGGVLLLVTWLYFGGLILLVGVVLNAVLADRLGTDDIRTEIGGLDRHTMTADTDDTTGPAGPAGPDRDRLDELDDEELATEIERLYDEIDRLEERVDERTVHRSEIERELRRYVRARIRRGKARGWGPYLVLLYGTAMTLGAFYLLSGGWAVLAMFVVWTSTLGLYALMLLVGAGVGMARLPGRVGERVSEFRR